MFGLFRPASQKSAIGAFAQAFRQIGFGADESKSAATKLVDESVAELEAESLNPEMSNRGDELVTNEAFMAPRRSAGLTPEDVRWYWNRTLLVVRGEAKMKTLLRNIAWNIAQRDGTPEGLRHFRATMPHYGDPDDQNSQQALSMFLGPSDKLIYPEFNRRVEKWESKISDAERKLQATFRGSLNALIHANIAEGKL